MSFSELESNGSPLVHSMSPGLTPPDWKPLGRAEVHDVLRHFRGAVAARGMDPATAEILRHSPRPMFAAALVGSSTSAVFVKRHDQRVRTRAGLAEEHAFASHLHAHGAAVPEVLRSEGGDTILEQDGSLYEVHGALDALDVYQDALSWSPYRCVEHAHAAGAALARFHLAAQDFPAPTRQASVLQDSTAIESASEPLRALSELLLDRPALAAALEDRPFTRDVHAHLFEALTRCARELVQVRSHWTHGDWHPSNLAWSSASNDAAVLAVFDLGLSNRTSAVHDLAVAIERATVDWLDLSARGTIAADIRAIEALLTGYQEIRPLEAVERQALPHVLPVCHVEYALSEIEYFADVVHRRDNADLAYDYLIGHARWFQTRTGSAVCNRIAELV